MKFDVMGDSEGGHEIDVRPVLDQDGYRKLMKASGGRPMHKVFVKRSAQKNKTEGGDVLEKIQYWYPEGECSERRHVARVVFFNFRLCTATEKKISGL